MNPIGPNVLGSYVTNRADLEDFINRSKPAACVIMDSFEIAQSIRHLSPETLVIHRTYNPSDPAWHEVTTPEAWLNAHAGFALNGVTLQVFNEPNQADWKPFLKWLLALMDLATQRGIRLVVGNFSVGTPHEKDIQNGVFDGLLLKLANSNHVLGLHEYFYDDPENEYPFLCGRFEFWLDRAKNLRIPAPKIVITEHGHDLGNGGWQTFYGGDQEKFWDRLRRARKLYKKFNIPVCIFCWGYGAGNQWESFNIERATYLKISIVAYQEDQPPMAIYPSPDSLGQPVNGRVVKVPATYVNVRKEPSVSSETVSKLSVGDRVVYRPNGWTQPDGQYTWYYIDSRQGWAFNGAVIAPDISPSKLITDLEFVSQIDPYSNMRNNDCLIACAVAVTRLALKRYGYGKMPFITVNQLIGLTPLASRDVPLNFLDARNLFDLLGLSWKIQDPLDISEIIKSIDRDVPALLLGNYKYIDTNSKAMGHWFLATGYVKDSSGNVTHIVINDSYYKGESYYMTVEQMKLCLTDVSPFASKPFQGFVFYLPERSGQ